MSSYETHYQSNNYPREFNNDAFYYKIIKAVINDIGRPLTKPETNETINFITKLDPSLLTPSYLSKTIKIVVSTLVDEFKKFNCNKPQYDNTQDLLRETIGTTSETSTAHGIYDEPKNTPKLLNTLKQTQIIEEQPPNNSTSIISSLLGLTNSNNAARILNPKSLLRKNYMLLDSRYRVLNGSNTNGISSITWNTVLQSVATSQGTVNIVGNVRDIVSIRIYPCRIPYVKSADNKYSRVSILIDQLSSQSFITHERNFHFMLESAVDDNFINLHTRDYNDGYFYFEKPITTLNKLTLSFGSPLESVIFDKDRDYCTIDYFSIHPLTKITTGSLIMPTPHNLMNGDTVYFSNFKSGILDPFLIQEKIIDENIVNNINSLNGFFIHVIDATSFSIVCDTSNIQSPITDLVFDVFYGSKRLIIPIEITYIMPEP